MKILIVQTSFLGDTILSTPVIAGISKAFPDAALWMMTTPQSAALVERDPLLSGIIPFAKRKEEAGFSGIVTMAKRLKSMDFNRAYVLHRSFRTAIILWLSKIPDRIGFKDAKLNFLYTETRSRHLANHDVLRNLSLIDKDIPIKQIDTDLRLFPPDKQEISQTVRRTLPPAGSYIVLVPGSVWKTKMWSPEGYREVARRLCRAGHPVVLVGGPEERALSDTIGEHLNLINLAGKSNIADVMFIIKHARLVLCNDSMALHIACAFKVPVVSIFCATSTSLGFSPWKNNSIVVEKAGLACRPCGRHGGNTCPTGTRACITGITPDDVMKAVSRLLSSRFIHD